MTNYTKKILNCNRDSSNTVLSILVEWYAEKAVSINGVDTVLHTSTKDNIGLQPPPENCIPFESIDKETMMSWYEQHIAQPSMAYNSSGELVEEDFTYYDAIIGRLDFQLEEAEYKSIKSETEFPTTSGLPFDD